MKEKRLRLDDWIWRVLLLPAICVMFTLLMTAAATGCQKADDARFAVASAIVPDVPQPPAPPATQLETFHYNEDTDTADAVVCLFHAVRLGNGEPNRQKGILPMKSDCVLAAFRSALTGDRERLITTIRQIAAHEQQSNNKRLSEQLSRLINHHANPRGQLVKLPQHIEAVTPLLPSHELQSLLLPPDVRESLSTLKIERERSDLLAANNLRPRNRLLFHGPPGNGKTAAAEAVANLLGVPLLFANHHEIIDSHMGESAKSLAKLFQQVSQSACVLFIDEFDGIASKRESRDSAAGKESNRITNQLLMLMDAMPPAATLVAATNRMDCLDGAVLRRFDSVLEFPMPTAERLAAYVAVLKRRHPILLECVDEIDIESLVGCSFAEVETMAMNRARELVLAVAV